MLRPPRIPKKMAKVQLTNVTVLDNPTAFCNPFQFEITFECLEDLADGALLHSVSSHLAKILIKAHHFEI